MADTTILNGDIGVTWFDNNRCKYLEWIGGTNTEYTMNELYSAMQTLQDETTTIDDGTCFSAETPTEYTIGKIDQGDNDPWYIQFDLMEHINGGALKTSGWTRVTDTNTGIIVVPVDPGGTIVAADEGYDVTGATTGAGTLLEFIDTGGTWDYLVIRPDGSASSNDFTTVDQVITSARGAFTATQWDTAASTTGEQIWANIYTIGTVEDTVHMYIYQGSALTTDARDRVYSWNSATLDWYGNGHIDVTVALKDIEQTTWTTIDDGYLNVYARKGGDLYASFEVSNSTTSGGRNPVPLQTAVDLDQGHGTKKISTGTWTGTYVDGEIITDQTTLGRGILDLTNSTTDSELVYFPIATAANGGALTAMANTNTINGEGSGTSVASSGPTDDGPADSAWFSGSGAPTLSIAAATADIDDDGTNEYYGISIDCNQNRLSEVYQWVKYICQYGQGTGGVVDTAESGIYGEEYIGATAYIAYTQGSSTTPDNIVEGESVTQQTSGATGVVLSHDTTNDVVLLRSTRGTFDTNTIDADDDSSTFGGITTVNNFAAKTASPFGTFAGGTFFGARGVLLTDYHADDTNLFILTDAPGGTRERPVSLTFKVTNLVGGAETSVEHDRVSWYQLTGAGGNIDKDMFGGITGTPAAGDATLAMAGDIEFIPDSGTLVIVQNPGSATATEYNIRYSSWSGATDIFTLANTTGTCDDVGSTTTATNLNDSGASFTTTAKRGDLVYASGRGYGYVKTVNSNTVLTLEGTGITGLVDTDTYELNAVPVALDTGDDVYVPYIQKIATTDEESTSFRDPTTAIYYRVKVRNTRNTTTKIEPFSTDGNTTSANVTVQVVRSEDTIIT
jgi:hypothetical protein